MKTGVLFNDFGKTDKNYQIMTSMNQFVKTRTDELCAFIMNVSHKIINTDFAYINISDVSHFNDGLLIATSIDTADVLSKTSTTSKKCLYLWSIDWLGQAVVYNGIKRILSDKNLKIITRSQLQADIIKNNYNVDAVVLEEFDVEKINEICS